MQQTETKETIGNKENAKMLFSWTFVSVLFLVKIEYSYLYWYSDGYEITK